MMNKKTFVEKKKEHKEQMKKQGYGVGITGMPKWLWREFIEDAKANFSDCYWAKLLDWRNKAFFFDMLHAQGYIQDTGIDQQDTQEINEEEDNDSESIQTFAGKIK